MAALCMLPFCSWVLLPEKNNQSSEGMDSYGILWHDRCGNCYRHVHMHHLLLLMQQNWDHNLIPVSSADLQELGHPSGCHLALSENMQLQPGCWGVQEKMPGCFVWRQESACCYRYAPKEDLCCRAGRNGGLERHK